MFELVYRIPMGVPLASLQIQDRVVYATLCPLLGNNGASRQGVCVLNAVHNLVYTDAIGIVGKSYDAALGFSTTFSAHNQAINNHSP